MNKFIKCWVFIICLLFIFLILFTDKVNAETLTGDALATYTSENLSITTTITNNVYTKQINFDKGELLKSNFNSIKGRIIVNNRTQNKYYTNLLPDYMNCQHVQSYGQSGSIYTITYADGTHAYISGQDYDYLCDQWYLGSQTQTYYQYNFDNNPSIIIRSIGHSGNWYNCYIDSVGQYTCPLNENLKGIVVQIYTNGVQSDYFIRLQNEINKVVNDTQQIINNDNQNAQQQHQDSQTINNSITSDNVTGNNSNSSITTIGNTFNTQGDFLLNLLTIPYNLWTSILNAISGSCSPIDVGTIFGEHLVFPCINLNSLLGGVWTTIIDVIFTGMIYSAFIRRVIKYFRELLTLDPQALETGGVKIW